MKQKTVLINTCIVIGILYLIFFCLILKHYGLENAIEYIVITVLMFCGTTLVDIRSAKDEEKRNKKVVDKSSAL